MESSLTDDRTASVEEGNIRAIEEIHRTKDIVRLLDGVVNRAANDIKIMKGELNPLEAPLRPGTDYAYPVRHRRRRQDTWVAPISGLVRQNQQITKQPRAFYRNVVPKR